MSTTRRRREEEELWRCVFSAELKIKWLELEVSSHESDWR
jgi:hypothetical protein